MACLVLLFSWPHLAHKSKPRLNWAGKLKWLFGESKQKLASSNPRTHWLRNQIWLFFCFLARQVRWTRLAEDPKTPSDSVASHPFNPLSTNYHPSRIHLLKKTVLLAPGRPASAARPDAKLSTRTYREKKIKPSAPNQLSPRGEFFFVRSSHKEPGYRICSVSHLTAL